MVDFTDILNKPADAVEKPKPKPVTTYQAVVAGMPSQSDRNTKDGEVRILTFNYKLLNPIDPDDDVREALADLPPISDWTTMRHEFWFNNENAEFNLKNHLTNVLGIDLKGKTLGEGVAEAPGKGLLVTVKHRPFTRAGATEAEIATEVGGVAAL